jgi:hypothetical protein
MRAMQFAAAARTGSCREPALAGAGSAALRIAAAAAAAAARRQAGEQPARFISSRPGQPLKLGTYVRGPEAIPVPGPIRIAEAERLGRLTPEGIAAVGTLEARAVPRTPAEFERARREYRARMATVRKGFIGEVAASQARYAAAAAEFRARVEERKAEGAALKAIRKAARDAATGAELARTREARRMRAELGARKVTLSLARADEARRTWLRALVSDAAQRWVPADRIDEAITPELFGLKYAWQHAPWFEARDRKRRMQEAARRAKVR